MRKLICFLFLLISLTSKAQTLEKYKAIADSLEHKGENNTLIAYFQKELQKHQKNEELIRRLAKLYLQENKLDLSEKYYTEALKLNPACVNCYLNMGILYSYKNNNQKALDYFNKALKLEPLNASIYEDRAKIKAALGDKFGALFYYSKAIELEPKNATYYLERATFQARQNNIGFAISDLNTAIELEPNNYKAYLERANNYYSKQQYKEAFDDLSLALKIDSTQEMLYTGRGAIYSAINEHQKAIADYNTAIELNPKNYFPYYQRALEKYALENMDGSCMDIEKSLSLMVHADTSNPEKVELLYLHENYCDTSKASFYYQRGIAYYNQQEIEKAISIYTIGLTKFPKNAMLLSFRGNAYLVNKEYPLAISDYTESTLNKENLKEELRANQKRIQSSFNSNEEYLSGFIASNYLSLAEATFALGKYEEALVEINKGIELAPNLKQYGLENYYNVRGNILLALEKNQEAKNDFDTCLKLNPKFSIAYVNRAIAKIKLAKPIKISTYSIGTKINDGYYANWNFPVKTSLNSADPFSLSAISDCNKAIELDPKLDFAYYIRAQAKKLLKQNDFCFDLFKSKELGYPIEVDELKLCH
ncbi:MAG: hypothetical protein CFE21_10950 [Bacteroidetes bacterium B1(2017)]|nr:MAG: hypothetical protein CFE21_10950 [Bacteroidetes bacterium B1(2017)]